MYKRMLRAVVATAFSAALAYGALAVGGDIGWGTKPVVSATEGTGGDIGWSDSARGSVAQGGTSGDIGWIVAPKNAPKDIGWHTSPAGTGA